MPVTARLSRKFYDKFGDDVTKRAGGLVQPSGCHLQVRSARAERAQLRPVRSETGRGDRTGDRKSTRLNSSHGYISYAVFCLKKKKTGTRAHETQTDSTHDKLRIHMSP